MAWKRTMNRPSHPSKLPAPKFAKTAWPSAETEVLLATLTKSLRQGLADHQSLLEILLERQADLPLALGELLEDAGNAYIEMSESVSRRFLTARRQVAE
jgi:hypothetical protein